MWRIGVTSHVVRAPTHLRGGHIMGDEEQLTEVEKETPAADDDELVILAPPEETETPEEKTETPKGGDAIKQLRSEVTTALTALGEQMKGVVEQSERTKVYHGKRTSNAARRTAYKRDKRAAAKARAASNDGDTAKLGLGRRLHWLRRTDD